MVTPRRDSDHGLAEAAANALTKIGSAAVPPLLEALKDENPIRRSQAARALGEINVPDAVPALLELLHDTDGTVRESAVLALWRMGGPEAAAGLTQALEDPDGLIRSRAAPALGGI